MTRDTTNERLARLETQVEHICQQSQKNGKRAEEILCILMEKIDRLDTKIENRFNKIEEHAYADAKDLAILKNRGMAFLAGLGAVFTVIATAFSDVFVTIKHAVFG
jgi:hypothetical protein